jgi:hypothetical protein
MASARDHIEGQVMFNDYMGEAGFWQEPDPFLVDLVSGFVNKGGMELGITLFMKGQVITGTLVSERITSTR